MHINSQSTNLNFLTSVKIVNDYDGSAQAAILTLVLLLQLPTKEQRRLMAETLISIGATVSQADLKRTTAFHWTVFEKDEDVLDVYFDHDQAAAKSVIDHATFGGWSNIIITPLITAYDETTPLYNDDEKSNKKGLLVYEESLSLH